MEEVNVELLTTGFSSKANIVRLILISSSVLMLSLILLPTSGFTASPLSKVLMALAFIGVIFSGIWLNIQPSNDSIGKLTFSEGGLRITSDTTNFLELREIGRCKIDIQDYYGKPRPSLSAIFPYDGTMNPYDGTMNMLSLDHQGSTESYRFKLSGKQHSDRLIDVIEFWSSKNPEIKLNVSWW